MPHVFGNKATKDFVLSFPFAFIFGYQDQLYVGDFLINCSVTFRPRPPQAATQMLLCGDITSGALLPFNASFWSGPVLSGLVCSGAGQSGQDSSGLVQCQVLGLVWFSLLSGLVGPDLGWFNVKSGLVLGPVQSGAMSRLIQRQAGLVWSGPNCFGLVSSPFNFKDSLRKKNGKFCLLVIHIFKNKTFFLSVK